MCLDLPPRDIYRPTTADSTSDDVMALDQLSQIEIEDDVQVLAGRGKVGVGGIDGARSRTEANHAPDRRDGSERRLRLWTGRRWAARPGASTYRPLADDDVGRKERP